MPKAIRLRLIIFGALMAGVAGGLGYTYVVDRTTDRKASEELAFAYDSHLKTVRELMTYAREHAIEPALTLDVATSTAESIRPNARDRKQFGAFVRRQREVTSAARELITTLDGDLDPTDGHLARLIRRFDSEERGLRRIHDRSARAGFGWPRASISP